jgi:hypothetical protein
MHVQVGINPLERWQSHRWQYTDRPVVLLATLQLCSTHSQHTPSHATNNARQAVPETTGWRTLIAIKAQLAMMRAGAPSQISS